MKITVENLSDTLKHTSKTKKRNSDKRKVENLDFIKIDGDLKM